MPDEGQKLVLVVDDDFDIRDAVADVLVDRGFAVASVEDGFSALEWLRTHSPPAVILLDWMMPRCDGPTFRAEQQKDPSLADIPVVLLTADATARERAPALGLARFLQKPVDLDELLAAIHASCC